MPTTIEIDPEVDARLDDLAARAGKPKHVLLRQLIEGNIDDLEDYYHATEILRRIESGEERTYTSAEVRAELGLDD